MTEMNSTKMAPNTTNHVIADLGDIGTVSSAATVASGITTVKKVIIVVVVCFAVTGGLAVIVVPTTLALTHTGIWATTQSSTESETSSTAAGTNGATIVATTIGSTVATTTTAALPSQCSSYTTISDATRLTTTGGGSVCDSSVFSSSITWVRFTAPGGTQLATTAPLANQCGTQATGWYSGTMPSSGSTVNGTACYVWGSNTCNWSNNIRVTNCGSFYVYGLILPPMCNARYCTV